MGKQAIAVGLLVTIFIVAGVRNGLWDRIWQATIA